MIAYTDFFPQKISELNSENEKMLNLLQVFNSSSTESKQKYREILQQEFQMKMEQLKDEMEHSRSQAMKELAKVQYQYFQTMKNLLQNNLPGYLHNEESNETIDKEEAGYLYTEFVFDFIKHSLLSATMAYMDIV